MYQAPRLLKLATLLAAAGIVGGCALPAHNNTLIFAVKRDVGVGVSTPSATDPGGTINLGYSEREVAWVPLWANGPGKEPLAECYNAPETPQVARQAVPQAAPATAAAPQPAVTACSRKPKFAAEFAKGKGGDDDDAYSVFASFGGGTRASANSSTGTGTSSGPTAELKVASFFATGIAAQRLADKNTAALLGGTNGSETAPEKPAAKPTEQETTRQRVQDFLVLTQTDTKKTEDMCLKAVLDGQDKATYPALGDAAKGLSPADSALMLTTEVNVKSPERIKLLGTQAELLAQRYAIAKKSPSATSKDAKSTDPAEEATATNAARKAVCV